MRYLKITGPDVNNGPGCRITLWIPGCGHKCKGCHNEWTHMYNQGSDFTEDTYRELIDKLSKPYIAGLTISGGDPLYQSNNVLADLYEWIIRVRTDLPDKTIWLYTGFKFEDLQGIQMEIVQKCDVVVDGPYIEELRDTTLEFRGSSNQRIIHIGQNNSKETSEDPYIISEQNENNMRQTTFKGIINGQEFDNVQDYNAKMNELIAIGAKIDASSSTQIKEQCKNCPDGNCTCEPRCEETSCEASAVVDMIPVFGTGNYDSVDEYLDEVVSEDSEKNDDELVHLQEYLADNHEEVLKRLDKMDEHSLENYKMDLVKVLNVLKEANHDNNDAMSKVKAKYRVLAGGSNVLGVLLDEYNSLVQNVDGLLSSHRSEHKMSEDKASKMPTKGEIQEAIALFKQLFGVE